MVIYFICVRCNASLDYERLDDKITSVMCLTCYKNYINLPAFTDRLLPANVDNQLPKRGEWVVPIYTISTARGIGRRWSSVANQLYIMTLGGVILQRDIRIEEISRSGQVVGDMNKALISDSQYTKFVEFHTSKPTTLMGHNVTAHGLLCRP